MLNDLRLAARMLLQAKGWTAVVLVCLALGIGANTALFSAINGLLLKKLPVSDPDTLVRFRYAGPNQVRTDVLIYGFTAPDARGRQVEPTFSYPMYLQLARRQPHAVGSLRLRAVRPPERRRQWPGGHRVRIHLVRQLLPGARGHGPPGPHHHAGRRPADGRAGRGHQPQVLDVAVRRQPETSSGRRSASTASRSRSSASSPPEFTGVEQAVSDAPDVSLPLALEPQFNAARSRSRCTQPNFWWLQVMGRLKPGVTAAQVHGNLAGVFQHTARAGFDSYLSSLSPEARSRPELQDRTQIPELLVDSGSRGIYDVTATDLRAVTVLTAVVALVLLIVCANVANLLLSRATARQKELSVRLALGATRARLVRQLLTESLLLAGIGGALGILVGRWGQQLLPGATGHASPLDWRVLAFVITVTTLTGIVFGIAPALRATRTDVNVALKENSRNVAGSRSLFGRSLVVAQVAISLVLLIGAGLFLRTLQNLRQVDVGFNPRNVVLFRISPALNRYDRQKENLLYDQIGERLRAIAGVRSVAWSHLPLMSARRSFGRHLHPGPHLCPGAARHHLYRSIVSPTFFETMEIPLLAGRGFTARDTNDAPRVVVINEAAARKYFPNENPIGRRIGSTLEDSGRQEIVGILRDAKYNSVRDAAVPTQVHAVSAEPSRQRDLRGADRRRSARRDRRHPRSRPAGRSEPCRSST